MLVPSLRGGGERLNGEQAAWRVGRKLGARVEKLQRTPGVRMSRVPHLGSQPGWKRVSSKTAWWDARREFRKQGCQSLKHEHFQDER